MNLQSRILEAIGTGGIRPDELYNTLAANSGREQIDQTISGMMRAGAVERVFGNYQRGKGKVPTPPNENVEDAEVSKEAPQKNPAISVERSAAGLREALFDTIDALRAGRIDVQQANAIAKSAETILKSVDVQISYERLRLDSKTMGDLGSMPLVAALPHERRGT